MLVPSLSLRPALRKLSAIEKKNRRRSAAARRRQKLVATAGSTRPSLRAWLLLNFKIGFLSFAPASRAALYRDAIVSESRWITDHDFQESLTLAQFLPGPNLVNLSVYLGFRLLGFWSVVAGLLCLAVPGALLAVVVVETIPLHNPHIEQIFRGFSLGSVALMLVFLWRLRAGMVSEARAKRTEPNARPRRAKLVARFAILATATVASCLGMNLQTLLMAGVPVSLLVEFSL